MKRVMSICMMVLCMFMLCACGNNCKNEEEILADMNVSNLIQEYIGQGLVDCTIEKITIEKRNIIEDQTDDIYAQIEVCNEETKIVQNVHLIYNYYSENGWVFDQYMLEDVVETLPLKGVKEKTVKDILDKYGLYKNIEIKGQNTNLEEGLDEVVVNVSTETDLCKISGDITVKFYFENGQWVYQSIENKESYSEEWYLEGSWIWDGRNQGDGIRVYLVSEDNTCERYYISFYDDDRYREYIAWDAVVWEVADVYDVSADGVARRIVEQGGNIRDLLYGNINPYGIENYGVYFEKISDEMVDIEELIKRFQSGSDPTLDDDIELIRQSTNEILEYYYLSNEEVESEGSVFEMSGKYALEWGSSGESTYIYSDVINLDDYIGSYSNIWGIVEKTEDGYILRVDRIEELDIDFTQVS